jgi:DNA polymerase-1
MSYNRIVVSNDYYYRMMIDIISQGSGWIAFDTETTGLHLKQDTPFLLTISITNYTFALDLLNWWPHMVQRVVNLFKNYELAIGHNVKFDLHMLSNIGITYNYDNLADTMTMARLSLETDEMQTIALKALAKKYLTVEAGQDELQIKAALTNLKRHNTSLLKAVIKEQGMTKKAFDEMAKDTLYEPTGFHKEFLDNNPEPTYLDIYKDPIYTESMLSYAMNDTEITLELAKLMYPVLVKKEQVEVFERECRILLPLFRMERVGLRIDRDYLNERKEYLKKYIKGLRGRLRKLSGVDITIGQHKALKDLFETKWDIVLNSTDDGALKAVEDEYQDGDPAEFANIIRELRTLEKWYSVYIMRMLEKSEYDGRAYTQINTGSAVTGRVSSDFQQFPKNAIYEKNGMQLLHPRRMVVTTGDGYESTFYLDYSQIELRVQANYTYEISGGDLNMCRAYMPFKCHNNQHKPFDPKEDRDLIFTQNWYKDEDNTPWHPVDLHSATAMQAFPDVDPNSEEFKKLRFLGKSTNFAKNYGATAATLVAQFGFDNETAAKMDNAYYLAFPKILDYQRLVRDTYSRRGFVKNRYGRRYYLGNRRFVYKLYNYIIQGTCADMLKDKIIEVDKLLLAYKSRFQMNIHDELSFEIYKGEEFLIPAIKKIMEDVDWMTVPVVADVEITTTNWAEKEDV